MAGWLDDVYDVIGVFVEENSEKPAGGTAEEAVKPAEEPVKGTNPNGTTTVYTQAQQNSMLKWALIGVGVLILLILFMLMVRK